jgi:hypothetical protein
LVIDNILDTNAAGNTKKYACWQKKYQSLLFEEYSLQVFSREEEAD